MREFLEKEDIEEGRFMQYFLFLFFKDNKAKEVWVQRCHSISLRSVLRIDETLLQ